MQTWSPKATGQTLSVLPRVQFSTRLETVNLTVQSYCNIAPPKVLMPEMPRISLQHDAEQVKGSNLGIPHFTLDQALVVQSHTTSLKLSLVFSVPLLTMPTTSTCITRINVILDLIARWVEHYFDPTRNQFFRPPQKLSRCLFHCKPLLHCALVNFNASASSTSLLLLYIIVIAIVIIIV